MANLTSRLVISLVDRASGPARGIAGSLRALNTAARTAPLATMAAEAKKTGQHLTAFATKAAAAGYGLYAFINATKEFNESKFGYGFARITDFIEKGKLDTKGWAEEMNSAAKAARKLAKEFGTTPSTVMKAREEVEKLGFKGDESESIWRAALGLHLSEPDSLDSGEAAKFVGAMYRGYAKQREALAKKLGRDANDPKFQDMWIKGLAGKAAVAGAESALGPADLIEGMRQYAPQWAQFGISPEYAMAALAHGSNYGFRAPELGTAFKSMANRLVKPTAEGLRWLNALGVDRSRYMSTDAADPERATNQLSSLLGGSLSGKNKASVRQMLQKAQRDGTTTSPEFQQELSTRVAKLLKRRTEQDLQEIEMAVSNATMSSGGQIDLNGLVRELIAKKAGPAAMMAIFEGRHYARGTPMFEFYDKMYALFEKLQAVDGSVIDNVVEGRKITEAGTADQLYGAWQDFLLQLQDSGVIEGVKQGLTAIADTLKAIGPEGTALAMKLMVVSTAAGLAVSALGAVVGVLRTAYALGRGALALAGIGGAGAAGTGALGARGMFGLGAGVYGGAKAVAASKRMVQGMSASRGLLASSKMIAGMGAAGAGGAAASTVGKGLVARLIPGVGWALTAAGLGAGGYAAYQDYQKNGDLWSAAKAGGMGFLTLGTSGAEAAEAPAGGAGAAPDGGLSQIQSQAQAIPAAVQAAMAQLQSIVGAVDLTAQGARIAQSLANGIRSGTGAIAAAARDAAQAAQVGSAMRGAYSDGGR